MSGHAYVANVGASVVDPDRAYDVALQGCGARHSRFLLESGAGGLGKRLLAEKKLCKGRNCLKLFRVVSKFTHPGHSLMAFISGHSFLALSAAPS